MLPDHQNAVRAPPTFCIAGCLAESERNEKRAKTETSMIQTRIERCRSKYECAMQILSSSMQFYPKQEKKGYEDGRVLDLEFLRKQEKLLEITRNSPKGSTHGVFRVASLRKQCTRITPVARSYSMRAISCLPPRLKTILTIIFNPG